MSVEFFLVLIGMVLGAAVMYIVKEVQFALNKEPESVQARLNRCTLEVIRRDARVDIDAIPDEELVRGIAAGVLSVSSRTKPDGQ